jgi:hypothetical protein
MKRVYMKQPHPWQPSDSPGGRPQWVQQSPPKKKSQVGLMLALISGILLFGRIISFVLAAAIAKIRLKKAVSLQPQPTHEPQRSQPPPSGLLFPSSAAYPQLSRQLSPQPRQDGPQRISYPAVVQPTSRKKPWYYFLLGIGSGVLIAFFLCEVMRAF